MNKFLTILKKRAVYLAQQKGHNLGRFNQIQRTRITQRSFCNDCGFVVFVHPGRGNGQPEVFGAAVNDQCRGKVQP